MQNNRILDFVYKIAVIGLLVYLLFALYKPEEPDPFEQNYIEAYKAIQLKQDSLINLIKQYEKPNINNIENHYLNIIQTEHEKIDSNNINADIEYFIQHWAK